MSDVCDLLIVGAGPAAIAAACHAAEAGQRVTLVDDNAVAGGQIWRAHAPNAHAAAWLARLHATSARVINGASVYDIDASANCVYAERDNASLQLRYRQLLLATGARERFVPFPGWTLPGVVGVGAIQALVKGGFDVRRKRIVIAGTGPLLMAAASELGRAGAELIGIAEQTSWLRLVGFAASLRHAPSKIAEAFEHLRHAGAVPVMAHRWVRAAFGDERLQSVEIDGGTRPRRIDCDLLACGYGLVPNLELAQLAGCETRASVLVDDYQRTTVSSILAAGELCGIGGAELSLTEGAIAGLSAAGRFDAAQAHFAVRERQRRFAHALDRAFALRDELRDVPSADTVVCRCEDVRHSALKGHSNWREAKLATRCGMGPCQGRTCGASAEFLYGWTRGSTRPPAVATRLGTLGGTPTEPHTCN